MRAQLLFFYWMVLTSIECDDKEKKSFFTKIERVEAAGVCKLM